MPPLKQASAFALSLALAGCAAPATQIPLTETGALASFKPIPNSSRAPCQIQRAIAAHNSVYETLTTKREVIFRAPCDVDKGSAQKMAASNG